jgi:hypothetical protein
MIRYRLIHDNECLCDNLSKEEAHNLFLMYKDQHSDWDLEIERYNYAFGITHRWRDPDLH